MIRIVAALNRILRRVNHWLADRIDRRMNKIRNIQ